MIKRPRFLTRVGKSPTAQRFRPRLEQLEDRNLLSGTAPNLMLGADGTLGTPLGVMLVQREIAASNGDEIQVGTIYDAAKGNWAFAIARTTSQGQLDPTFGTGGVVGTPTSINGADIAYDVLAQPNGQYVVVGRAGISMDPAGTLTGNGGFALVRYNSDGSLDSSFGTKGEVVTPLGGAAVSAVLQNDGKIVVAGYANQGLGQSTLDGAQGFTVARYTTDGQLDSSFGGSGVVRLGVDGQQLSDAQSVVVQPDGKIVVAGTATTMNNNPLIIGINGLPLSWPVDSRDEVIARFNTDGALDTSFGTDGTIVIPSNFWPTVTDGVSVGANGAVTLETGSYALGFNQNGILQSINGISVVVAVETPVVEVPAPLVGPVQVIRQLPAASEAAESIMHTNGQASQPQSNLPAYAKTPVEQDNNAEESQSDAVSEANAQATSKALPAQLNLNSTNSRLFTAQGDDKNPQDDDKKATDPMPAPDNRKDPPVDGAPKFDRKDPPPAEKLPAPRLVPDEEIETALVDDSDE